MNLYVSPWQAQILSYFWSCSWIRQSGRRCVKASDSGHTHAAGLLEFYKRHGEPQEKLQPLSGCCVFTLDVLPFTFWVSVPQSQHRRHSDLLSGPGPDPVLSARFQTHLLNQFLSPTTLLTFSTGTKVGLLLC